MPKTAPTPIQVSPDPPVLPVGHSVQEHDRPQPPISERPPSLAWQAWNLATSLADFVADGCKTVTREQYQARLEICDACDHRRNNRCMKCGCRLSLKAQGRAFQCPDGKCRQWSATSRR